MNFPLFIARNINQEDKGKRQVSKPVIRIATAGVAIGLAVMIISVCVVLGFKHTIRDKIVGLGSHIQVADFLTLQTSDQYPIFMGDSMLTVLKGMPEVKHVQRYAYKQGILKTDNDFLGVVFKGMGPEFDTTFIHQNLVEGSIPTFSDEKSGNKILVSKTMADQLKLEVG
ncbi:MAG: ABC transporter permease, partial [Prevotella sp.]|nr:ABC transporter permease [Prevotella sp.]